MNRRNLLLIGILIVVGVGVYAFNFNNPLYWDDDDWIINNTFVHSISWNNIKFWFTHNTLAGVGLQSNYYRPFLFFTFALNWVVSETKPFLWHLVSNSIHIANAVLVFILLRKYLGQIVAFLTALIFTIHPLNTEAVTYISGRGDPLSVFFILLALVFYLKSRSDLNLTKVGPWNLYKTASVVSMVLAVLTRETGVTFPALFMVFYIAFISKDKFTGAVKRAFSESLPYWGVAVVYGILRITVLNFQNTLNFYTAPNLYSENLIYRLFTFMHVLVDYFRLLFVPTGLHMERSMVVHTSLFQWPVWLGALIIVGIIYVGYRFYRLEIRNLKLEIQPNSNFRIWLWGWAWFFIGLAMVSGIIPINAVIYEHWLYLPMIGFWAIAAFYLVKLFEYLKNRRFLFVICILLFGAYISFFGLQSIKRNVLWGKPVEFFQDILKYEPESVRINNNMGNLYFNQGDTEKAEEYYRKAIESEDVFPQPHFNIGSILQSRGDIFGAIKEYEKAISIDPNFHYPYQNLVAIYASQGDLVKATGYIEILKQLKPYDPRVFYNAALIYLARNDSESAVRDLERGLEVSGSDPEAERLIKELLDKAE